MAIYQVRTFGEIVKAVREQLSVSSTDTNSINQIKRDINIIYDEVTGEKNWWWLQDNITKQLPAYISAGTVSVTQNSSLVTFSVAPAMSQKGRLFIIDGNREIYTIESHTAGSTTAYLTELYTSSTNSAATYKLFSDRIPLPVDCRETIEVWHGHHSIPLEARGRQDFRKIVAGNPKAEGRPQYYYTGTYKDPSQFSSITSLPATATRSSSGIIKTIVFSTSVPTSVVNDVNDGKPVRWNVSGAADPSYNGNIIISSILTTTNTNDTITYTGHSETQESSTADTGISIKKIDTEEEYDRYRQLYVYPYLSTSRISINIDYLKEVYPLENDDDEPLVPKADRNVLMFGAVYLGHMRQGNDAKAQQNFQLYQNRLARMSGRHQDSMDTPRLSPSKIYLNSKRNIVRNTRIDARSDGWGGGSSGQVVTGTAQRVAHFNDSGELTASSSVDYTELSYLNDSEPLASATLTDNTTTTVDSWAVSTYDAVIIDYSIKRGSSNKECGTLYIATDGSTVDVTAAGASVGTLGVTFDSSDINSGNLRLRATCTSTGTDATFKYTVRKWLA